MFFKETHIIQRSYSSTRQTPVRSRVRKPGRTARAMSFLQNNNDRLEAAETIAVTSNMTVAETSRDTLDAGISSPKDIIPIAALSIQDNAGYIPEKGTSERQRFDEVAGAAKENGGQAATRSSHKDSTRRNLSNMLATPRNAEKELELTNGRESSLSGTPPSAEGYRDEMMAQWLVNRPWPSGPSFDSDSLSEEARRVRDIARLSALASVGTTFAMPIERQDNYPQDILIEEDMEASNEVPTKSSKDGC
ncbi:hypothetical protein V8F06_007303 [Rhypophila decipiens]